MNTLLRKALTSGLFWIARNYEKVSIDMAKIEAASLYVKTVRDVRYLVMGIIGLTVLLNMLVGSFLLLNFAIVWYLPVSTATKALILLIASGLYFLATLIVVLVILSQKLWMKKSKADRMVENAAGFMRHRHA
jgi:protein-S-isoprenylcysteine O-methyltransferase Ste14